MRVNSAKASLNKGKVFQDWWCEHRYEHQNERFHLWVPVTSLRPKCTPALIMSRIETCAIIFSFCWGWASTYQLIDRLAPRLSLVNMCVLLVIKNCFWKAKTAGDLYHKVRLKPVYFVYFSTFLALINNNGGRCDKSLNSLCHCGWSASMGSSICSIWNLAWIKLLIIVAVVRW